MAKGSFDVQKTDFCEKLWLCRRSFIIHWERYVDAREIEVFVGITTKYVIKETEKLLSLRKVYCEIVIAPKYYKVNQESLRNNLFKSFQLYLYMYILFSCLLTYLMNKLRLLKIYLL